MTKWSVNVPMKITFYAVMMVFLLSSVARAAQTVYVSEDFEITMRTGPSTSHKIISLVQSGEALEMLKKGEEWSMVRTPGNKEGWVLNRYLTSQTPCAMVLEQIREDHERLKARLQEQQKTAEELGSQKQQTDAQLSRIRQERDELSKAYETLKRESSEFLRLKERHQEVVAGLEEEKARSTELYQENQEMKRSRTIHWVMTGGGIMLIGFFIGLFSAGRRRPRSSLY